MPSNSTSMSPKDLGKSPICQAVVSALQTAIEKDMPEMMEENELYRGNGKGQFRWNFVIRNLKSASYTATGMEFCDPKRGAWRLALAFEREPHILYSLMSKATFDSVQRNAIDRGHYLAALAQYNTGCVPAQVAFLDADGDISEEWVHDTQAQLTSGFSDKIDHHFLIVFECKVDKITGVEGIVLTPNMQISTRVPLTGLLSKPFDASSDNVHPNRTDDDDGEFLVELRD